MCQTIAARLSVGSTNIMKHNRQYGQSSAHKLRDYSNDANDKLSFNAERVNEELFSKLDLGDPVCQSFRTDFCRMQDLFGQISVKINDVSKYCDKVIRWIDEYTET